MLDKVKTGFNNTTNYLGITKPEAPTPPKVAPTAPTLIGRVKAILEVLYRHKVALFFATVASVSLFVTSFLLGPLMLLLQPVVPLTVLTYIYAYEKFSFVKVPVDLFCRALARALTA